MTFPEDLAHKPVVTKAPNYALGFVLNFFLAGSGFTYINLWPWHLGWLGILVVLWIVGAVLGAATQSSVFGLLPFLGWVAQLVHYQQTYQKAAERGFRPVLHDGIKMGLIVGHFFLGFIYVGLLAAVLIPNLLSAKEKAIRTGEQATASNIYIQVLAAQAEGKTLSETCPTTSSSSQMTKVTDCHVDLSDPENPALDVTFESGRSIHLPEN